MNGLLREHGITHDQYNVLRILRGAAQDGHTVAEVGRRMVSRAPDVTRLLDRLERRGLITRAWAPENRRFTIARITAAGLELMTAVDPELHTLQQELMRDASPEGARRAHTHLRPPRGLSCGVRSFAGSGRLLPAHISVVNNLR